MNSFLLRSEAVHFNCCVAGPITPNNPSLPVADGVVVVKCPKNYLIVQQLKKFSS